MHNHNHSNNQAGHDSKMMWLMMLGCLLPIILLTFIGGTTNRLSLWWIVGAGVFMLGLHAWSQRNQAKEETPADDQQTADDKPADDQPADQTKNHHHPAPSSPESAPKHGCC